MRAEFKTFYVTDMMVPEPVPEPEPQPDCEVTCRNDDDCEAISDDSYCDQIGACGTNENGEPLGYCYALTPARNGRTALSLRTVLRRGITLSIAANSEFVPTDWDTAVNLFSPVGVLFSTSQNKWSFMLWTLLLSYYSLIMFYLISL